LGPAVRGRGRRGRGPPLVPSSARSCSRVQGRREGPDEGLHGRPKRRPRRQIPAQQRRGNGRRDRGVEHRPAELHRRTGRDGGGQLQPEGLPGWARRGRPVGDEDVGEGGDVRGLSLRRCAGSKFII
ncbi:hypothetical protein THAOC_06171, partial [Thalassiosira oceanica]